MATGLAVVAWAALTAGLVVRGLKAGHWPLTNRYEFTLCFVWATLAVYLLLEASGRDQRVGAFVMLVALLLATYAQTRPAEAKLIRPLLPVLRSVWLQLHVGSSALAYGAFAVAGGLGGMALVRSFRVGESRLPSPEEIERTLGRAIALGLPWMTLSILTGAIWAQTAWGRYWGWDPKETWALITWVWYLLLLHIRTLRAWRGRRLAGLAVAGFGVVLFTFLGVGWLVRQARLESLHGF